MPLMRSCAPSQIGYSPSNIWAHSPQANNSPFPSSGCRSPSITIQGHSISSLITMIIPQLYSVLALSLIVSHHRSWIRKISLCFRSFPSARHQPISGRKLYLSQWISICRVLCLPSPLDRNFSWFSHQFSKMC